MLPAGAAIHLSYQLFRAQRSRRSAEPWMRRQTPYDQGISNRLITEVQNSFVNSWFFCLFIFGIKILNAGKYRNGVIFGIHAAFRTIFLQIYGTSSI